MIKFLLVIIFVFFIWGFFIEPNLIVIKKYKHNLPTNKKIIFISDLHISKYDSFRLKRIVKLINKQNPDLVLSCGDYIKGHTGKTTMDIDSISKELSKIKAPVITVLGNHDGWYDKYRVRKALQNNGIKVLSNSSTKFDDIYIAGVDDLQTGNPDATTALENTENPVILLTHSPDIYYEIKEDVDLILAGHVHGGQVRIPFYGGLILPSKYGKEFEGGEYKYNKNKIIVTKGLGTSILNVRFLDIPEIVFLS